MNFLNRAKKRLYKSYKSVSVEYHAGGFFIRKEAIYLLVDSEDCILFLEKNEGLHPYDNQYNKVVSEIFSETVKSFTFLKENNNIVTFRNTDRELKLMPSIFSENFTNNVVSEILVDFGGNNFLVFSLIHELEL